MSAQQGLTHDPGAAGLWRKLLDTDGNIDHHAWLRAHASGEFVGNCRSCGDYLVPIQPTEISGRFDYSAYCRQTESCRYELNAPGGRVLRRSARLSERSKGAGA